ncbi:MAG: hypothetical protein JWN40_2850 [Phycisphaerales bacterium]|jgi:hypothetical protein|nr:hypothetical protein [Phycisphaerales bacterium]
MDPYLEQGWRDVHTTLISGTRARLNQSLPPDLVARSEDRVYVEADGERLRAINPDVRVSEQPPTTAVAQPNASNLAIAQPVLIELDSEPVTEHFIEIVEAKGDRVVTAIEFVSPTNKVSGPGQHSYLEKRGEFLDSRTNLVEIDLVRGGDWLGLMRPYRVPLTARTTYRACVRRADRPSKAEFYPITLRQRLPTILIPLRKGDAPVAIDLQELLDNAYETGRYEGTDYRLECEPPLQGEDAAWADHLLRNAGRR